MTYDLCYLYPLTTRSRGELWVVKMWWWVHVSTYFYHLQLATWTSCGINCVILYGPSITLCNICMHIYILHDHIITNVEIYQNNVKLWVFFYNYFPPKILKSQISFKTQKFWQNSAKFIFLITHIKKKHEIFKMHNFS